MLAHTQIYFISPSSIFVISYHKLLTISRLKNSYDFFYHLTDNRLIISVLLLLHRQVKLIIYTQLSPKQNDERFSFIDSLGCSVLLSPISKQRLSII